MLRRDARGGGPRKVHRVREEAPGPVVFYYEAGVCGFALKRLIEAEGAQCIVIAPSLTPITPGEAGSHGPPEREGTGVLSESGDAEGSASAHRPEEAARDLVRCPTPPART